MKHINHIITWVMLTGFAIAQPELTNTEATNIDNATERQAWREALELWTDDSPTFTGGTYTGNLLVSGKLNVGNGALDDTHIVNFVSTEDVATEVMLHLEWNSPTPLAGDSNALLFSMYDSALNETEYSRFRSVIEDPTDGTEDGAMTVDVLNNGVLEQAVLFSHDEIIMNDNGADRNFIVKDNTTAEVLRITGGTGSIAMDGSTLFVDSANNRVGIGTATPSAGYALDVTGNTKINGYLDLDRTIDIYLGEIPSAPAYSGLWFAKNSSTATASNYSFLGDVNNTFLNGPTTLYLRTGNTTRATIDADGIEIAAGDSISFTSNSGSWDGDTITGYQAFTGSMVTMETGDFLFDLGVGFANAFGSSGPIWYNKGGLGGGVIVTAQADAGFYEQTLPPISGDFVITADNQTIGGEKSFSGQVELTGQAASTDDSAMSKGLVRDFSNVWGDVYKFSNGETDTNNKLSTVYAGDRFFNFSCYTGTAAGDGQWTTFHSTTFGLNYGSGAKGQLRDSFSFKFKFDSNTTTNTDVDLWLIRGKTANATLPVASDVCFALKFAGEEDLMIAVYDGVTAHTTTIDVSTINSWFTNLASQQEFMWTWDGTTAKVYGRYRKPAGTGDNEWSVWYTIGSLTPSGMAASTTNLSYAGLHFLQHTPVTCTSYTKNYIIWDLEHTSHVIAPN